MIGLYFKLQSREALVGEGIGFGFGRILALFAGVEHQRQDFLPGVWCHWQGFKGVKRRRGPLSPPCISFKDHTFHAKTNDRQLMG